MGPAALTAHDGAGVGQGFNTKMIRVREVVSALPTAKIRLCEILSDTIISEHIRDAMMQ